MSDEFFILKRKAVPEVLLKVVEAKRLVDTGKVASVQQAVNQVGISRSSFYKYKEDIFPFHDNLKGKTLTLLVSIDDKPGVLSTLLTTIARCHANILTINQSVPINGMASVTISLEIGEDTQNVSELVSGLNTTEGVHTVQILARE
ncbi:MAG: ACT domain-containing protein [Faecalicoccus sp.]|nr:ACT domain-containing protein [Faecalicoccus sp.]